MEIRECIGQYWKKQACIIILSSISIQLTKVSIWFLKVDKGTQNVDKRTERAKALLLIISLFRQLISPNIIYSVKNDRDNDIPVTLDKCVDDTE